MREVVVLLVLAVLQALGRSAAFVTCSMSSAQPEHAARMQEAAKLLRSARRVVVFTGAGMSRDSGIATFRKDSDSVWSGIKGGLALAYFGTPLGWRLTPGLAWQLYLSEFYKPIAEARPHAGHLALARLENERFGGDRCTVVTMNVDGLHTAAGSSDVVEVHGTVNRVLCKDHGAVDVQGKDAASLKALRCPECGAHMRPDVVLFTESLPANEWRRASQACRSLGETDCLLVVGTSGGVYPAAGLPEAAIAAGVPVVEINLDPSPISGAVTVYLHGRASETLPQLVHLVLSA